ncbi:DNA ligase [Seminavis robusta]|uniref:DNA ligase n=1 Tax=Seminavis robusta TaxID=568900 RepID=A0A9N8H896_9STRA|nr:DNA ligase [Seminavis robusta]|eukprot:Sro232_g093820.1 DNA ligase (EC 6.5.1.1) (491) ;mRNA; f:27581-29661
MALNGYVFCITGELSMRREEFLSILENAGAETKSSISSKVTHLICSDTSNQKYAKAISLGIPIISELATMAILSSGGAQKKRSSEQAMGYAAEVSNKKMPPAGVGVLFDMTADSNNNNSSGNLADGETVQVPNSKGNGFYTIKNVGGTYSCSCPAWKNQKSPINARTCKRIKAFRGEQAEQQRLGSVPVTTTASKSKAGKSKAATTAAPKSGGLVQPGKCMLAQTWSDNRNASDYILSEKLDGVRAIWDGTQLLTRSGIAMDAPAYFIQGLPTNMSLDGELFAGRGVENFNLASGIIRSSNGGDKWRALAYVVFDAPSAPGGFEQRLATANNAILGHQFAKIHQHAVCRDEEHLQQELARVKEMGGEGIMMRKKNSAYKFSRSVDLLKVKFFEDDEAIVVGVEGGKGKYEGHIGKLVCRFRNGTEFLAGTGLKDADRAQSSAYWIGKVVTVQYQDLFEKTGKPRCPSIKGIRTDLDVLDFSSAIMHALLD